MMNRRKMMIRALVCVIALCMLWIPAWAQESAVDLTGHIVILHTNDLHGRVDSNLGFSRVAYAKDRLEGAGATVLLLDAGDALHGLPFANISEGESVIEIMNEAGYDAMTAGNHDFNYGADRLKALSGMAQFPVLGSNVIGADGEKLLSGAVCLEIGNVKFGIFGLTTPETAYKTHPDNVSGVTFADPIETAKAEVAALEQERCTIIIALTHLGLDEGGETTSRMLAEQVPGIDVIVDGHSHTLLEEGLWVNNTLIVSAGEYIENIGCVDVDPTGLTAATLLTDEDFGGADGNEAIDSMIAAIGQQQDELLNVSVGSAGVELTGAREAVRTGETNLGNLAADALRSGTGAEIALINGGSIRESIPAGEITKKQLAAVFPFGNYAVTMEVTGEQLLALLENGVSLCPAADGRFPQVSGMTFRFDPSKEPGSRVTEVKIGGEALKPEGLYILATSDYIAAGGDEYPAAHIARTGEFGSMEEILIDYISTFEAAIEPETEGRITAEAGSAE